MTTAREAAVTPIVLAEKRRWVMIGKCGFIRGTRPSYSDLSRGDARRRLTAVKSVE